MYDEQIAGPMRAELTQLDCPWGQVFDLQRIRDVLTRVRPKALAIVQAPTDNAYLQIMRHYARGEAFAGARDLTPSAL